VHLTDAEDAELPFASTQGETEVLKVSRKSVARFLAAAVAQPEYVQRSVSLSGRKTAHRQAAREEGLAVASR
jgi:hypothetical protein